MAVFFGYTHCPDVCPTTLADLEIARDAIGPDADRLAVVVVSVDPERDTPETLSEYLSAWKHPVTGLTGSPAQLDDVARGYQVFSAKVPGSGGDCMVDHTAAVYLVDPEGALVDVIGYGEPPEAVEGKLRTLLAIGN